MEISLDFLKAILNTVSDHIVVIDKEGTILCTNESWISFGENNNVPQNTDWHNINYLQVCDVSAYRGDPYAVEAVEGIRKVIHQELDSFQIEYPCHSPEEQRWFIMRIKPFEIDNTAYYVISHQNITARKLAEEEVLNLSRIDGLCDIPNRRYFNEFFQDEWNRCKRLKMPITLVILDIDYFKLLNDTYGHQIGDECLKTIALQLKAIVQRPGDLCARYGGEEFALIFGNTSLDQSVKILKKLQNRIESLKIPNPASPIIPITTISIGVATLQPDTHNNPHDLIKTADDLLYTAKKEGRNRMVAHNGIVLTDKGLEKYVLPYTEDSTTINAI